MEHVAAFMLLVGCNADASVCREIPVPVAAYENAEECRSELGVQMRIRGVGSETVHGACKDVDEETFAEATTVDWSVTRSGKLLVTFDAAPQVVASR